MSTPFVAPPLASSDDPLRRIQSHFERYRTDPKRFAYEQLQIKALWKKQTEIMEAIRDNKFVAVPSGHMLGKSTVASMIAWWFKLCYRPSKVIVTAPGSRNVEFQTSAEIKARYRGLLALYSREELEALQLANEPGNEKWIQTPDEFMLWFTTKKDQASEHATRMAGFHAPHLLFIFDEAGAIEKEIWDSIDGSLMQEGRKLLAIGNPSNPSSEFARFCRRKDVKVIRLNSLEFPNVKEGRPILPYGPDKKSIDAFRLKVGEGSGLWHFKVLGLFPPQGSDALIGYDDVKAAYERPVKGGCPHAPGTVGIGVDVARFGDDRTVVWAQCSCGMVLEVEERQGQDTMATVGLVLEVARDRCEMTKQVAGQIAIDDTGVGSGVTDRLRELGWRVRPENFGESPKSEANEVKFVNRRAELWWGARDYLRGVEVKGRKPAAALAGLSIELQDLLRDELTAPRYKMTSDSRVKLEPKDEIKKRIGKSPDYADALCLALSAIPAARAQGQSTGTPPKPDPYYERDFGAKRDDDGILVGSRSRDVASEFSDW